MKKVTSLFPRHIRMGVLLGFTLLLVSFSLSSQATFTFRNGFGGTSGSERCNATCVDVFGNMYVTGSYSTTAVDFGTGTLAAPAAFEGFVAKYNSSGVCQWSFRFGGAANDIGTGIATDGSNTYITGTFTTSMTIGGSPTSYPSAGGTDGFVMKVSAATGGLTWVTTFGGGNPENAQAICLDPSGNPYVSGNFSSNPCTFGSFPKTPTGGANSDLFAIRLNPSSGAITWAATGGVTGNDNPAGSGICYVPALGEVVVAGGTNNGGTATYGAVSFATSALNDIVLLEINAGTGAFVSGMASGGSGNEEALGACYDSSTGDVFISGYFQTSSITFGTNPAINNSGGTTDELFYARYNPSSDNFIWSKSAGGVGSGTERARAICSNGQGGIYVTGIYPVGSTVFPPGGIANTLTNARPSGGQIFLAKISAFTGNAMFLKNGVTDATTTSDNSGNAVACNPNTGDVWLTGLYTSNTTFSPLASLASTSNSVDILIAKLIDPPLTATQSQVNLTCNGVCTGSATVVASGGMAPYTYSWSPAGGSGATASSLCAGTYTCTITDAVTTQITKTFTITQPPAIVISTVLHTNVSCFGGNNGAAQVSATGGTGTLTYNWTPGNPTGDGSNSISGLTAQVYTVTVTDGNSCTRTRTFNITAPSVLTSSVVSQTNVACFGTGTGAASISVSGGAPSYSYNWTPGNPSGDGSASVTGLTAQGYTCTVTDANGCQTTATANITSPSALVVSPMSQTNISCNGGSNGAASVSVSGGTTSYLYNWTPGNPTGDGSVSVTGLTAGTWTCTVTDANFCVNTATFNITAPPAIVVTPVSQTNISCNGGSNGAASVSASGGTPTLTYNWTPGIPTGDGTASVTGLTAGTWTCTVTDANACVAQQTFNITAPSSISVSLSSQTNISCNGGSNGAATINTPSGGAGGYTYNWTPGNPTGDGSVSVTGLTAGTWTCTVTDANACVATQTVNITQPSALVVSALSQTNVSTFGGSDGAASVSVSGGTASYSYNWTPGNPTGDGTASVTGLTAGTWTCTVTDANSCTGQQTFTITEPASLPASSLNFDGSNDYISINYAQAATNNTHEFWFKTSDANCGLFSITNGLPNPSGFDRDLYLSGGNISAYVWQGGPTETITTSGTNYADGNWHHLAYVLGSSVGGQKIYVDGVLKASGAATASGFGSNTTVLVGFSIFGTNKYFAGEMDEVRVWTRGLCLAEIQNNMNCEIPTSGSGLMVNYHFNQGFAGGTNTGLTTATDASTNGNNGALTGFALTGSTSNWSGPGAVSTGTSCSSFVPPSVAVTPLSQTNISCNGGSNGAASVSASGGSGYTYNWTPGNPTGDGTAAVTGLTAGTWTCTVTNDCGGSGFATFTITAPTALVVTPLSQTNISCNGGSNGAASVTVSGGTTSYSYNWAPGNPTGDGSASVTGLTSGTWTCTVTDANSCVNTATFNITAPGALVVSAVSQTNILCNGGSNGAASVTVSGGASSYSYNWTPGNPTGDGTASVTGLSAGTWTCTVTDANSCVNTATFNITAPTALVVTPMSQTNIACNGGSTGAASVSVSGGTTAYSYNWTPGNPTGDGTASVTGLTAGTWTCTVTDANSCVSTATFTITAPSAISSSVSSQTNIACNGGSTGSATISASGGAGGSLTYSWAPSGGTAATASGLSAGNYTCTITDENSCSTIQTVSITQPSAISSSVSSQTNVACNGGSNGSATISASGGTGSLTYSWAPSGGTAATASGLTAGNYTCTITDANSCSTTETINITQPSAISSSVSSQTNVACNGGSNGSATVSASGGTGSLTYSWAPSGGTAATASGLSAGTYTCTITDANSCSTTETATITQPSALTASSSSTPTGCSGSTGTATVTPGGGTPSYTYSWAPTGGTAAMATALAGGSYTCTITDANGCSINEVVAVTGTSAPVLTAVSQTNISCNGGSNGAASVSASGGATPYIFNWAPGNPSGDGTMSVTGLGAGTWTCTVSDDNGCIDDVTFTITQPSAISSSVSSQTNVACNGGSNGSATVSASGGTGSLTYSWAPSGGTAATASGLAAGSYTCTITDANSCVTTETVSITQPSAISSSVSSQTNVACNGGSNGSATVSASGGTGSLTYAWAPSGGTAATASGLTAGTYTCTITDANGCSTTETATITEPSAISSSVSSQANISCNGGSNGSATVSASGGVGSLTYSWAPAGGTAATATGLVAGTYTCTITDANSCSVTQTATITQPSALILSTSFTQASCSNNDGAIDLTVSGGTPSYTYSWSNGSTAQDISGLTIGTYTVTVTDANACIATRTQVVTQNCSGATQLAPSQCGQILPDLSGSFYCNMVTGAQDYQFEITNPTIGYSQTIARGNSNPNISKGAFSGLQYGQTYFVRVRAKISGAWGTFGATCTIQIGAAGIPTSQLVASQCGQTIADFSGSFNCVAVSGAVDYRFEFVNASLSYNFVINRGNASPNIAKNSITGLQYNTSYDVRVAVKVGTTWGAYGPVCSITMGPWPTSQMVVSQCNQTMNLLGDFNCTAVAGAQDYQWEFTNPTLGYTKVKVRGSANTNITKAAITGLLNGQTYTVKIKTKIAGAWGNYGPPCTITVNTSMMSPWSSDAREFEQSITDSPIDYKLIAYPNPSGENGFDISIDGLSETGANVSLTVYDIYGKVVYSNLFNGQTNGNMIKINGDGALSKGIYMIRAEVDNKVINQKVIVQ